MQKPCSLVRVLTLCVDSYATSNYSMLCLLRNDSFLRSMNDVFSYLRSTLCCGSRVYKVCSFVACISVRTSTPDFLVLFLTALFLYVQSSRLWIQVSPVPCSRFGCCCFLFLLSSLWNESFVHADDFFLLFHFSYTASCITRDNLCAIQPCSCT